ncbi:N-acetyllactosaminide beta-1,3-N-acetylglucosaminyltransferase 3-like [Dermacentor andersoni]|uniref:N-acetyllactosaminide beta-1,3-N-acetylglucosaminyltransferase 3-like n=1 Tax=Dermacentor andersoni TaxID=34620 RepID=UPI0021555587|nr:acetylgalactosaminyl-O-glycosyl-glycoprotein beta-1,3-N-acetylglucosaminyltransferase-like [Dermacentor andersoni]
MLSVVFLTQQVDRRMATPSLLLPAVERRHPTLPNTSLKSQDARPDSLPRSVTQQKSNATLPTKGQCPVRIDSLDGTQRMNTEWHSGGWAVRQRCSQPLDTLFFVHTAPKNWKNRVHLRATLFEEAATRFFNWTVVFFVGNTDDPVVWRWTKLEAEVMGDVVMLPYNDTLLTVLHKFIGGMRWVIDYCPNVRSIVKIDDDVGVHPFELRRYLEGKLPQRNNYMHCFVWLRNKVYRESFHRFCIREEDLPQDNYPLFCSGRSVILTVDTMRKLLRASKIIGAPPASHTDKDQNWEEFEKEQAYTEQAGTSS